MKIWIYTVLIKRIYPYHGVEYADTPSSRDIDCFTSHEQAMRHYDNLVDALRSQGYHITDSDAPDEDGDYSLMVRLENEAGHAAVIELAWKTAEAPTYCFDKASVQAPSKHESKSA